MACTPPLAATQRLASLSSRRCSPLKRNPPGRRNPVHFAMPAACGRHLYHLLGDEHSINSKWNSQLRVSCPCTWNVHQLMGTQQSS